MLEILSGTWTLCCVLLDFRIFARTPGRWLLLLLLLLLNFSLLRILLYFYFSGEARYTYDCGDTEQTADDLVVSQTILEVDR